MDRRLKSLAINFLDIGVMRFGAFKWKYHKKNPDAPLAPTYTNFRVLRSQPRVIRKLVRVLDSTMRENNLTPDRIADVPITATPFVSILMEKTGIPMISPRKDEKEYGIYTKVEGVFQPGQAVLLIDDVLSFADSKFEAMEPIKASGLIVKDVLVAVDNELGGREELEKAGINLWAVYTISELLALYLKLGRISQEEYQRIMASFDVIRAYFSSKRAQ